MRDENARNVRIELKLPHETLMKAIMGTYTGNIDIEVENAHLIGMKKEQRHVSTVLTEHQYKYSKEENIKAVQENFELEFAKDIKDGWFVNDTFSSQDTFQYLSELGAYRVNFKIARFVPNDPE